MTGRGSYCRSPAKRALDLILALVGLGVLLPVFAALSLGVLLSSGPPVLFRQERIGLMGRPFRMLKFRTMQSGGAAALPLTARGDPRVTPFGRLLRALKLDELPQLWNVVRGEMSLVGPRPEVPRYVAHYTAEQRRVLAARPGLTDPATVLFRNEEALLASIPEARRERYYLEVVLPEKLRLNLEYIDRASPAYDFVLVLRTIQVILRPGEAGKG